MPKNVVIVGAGILGLACAKHLAEDPDIAVTVVDRGHPGGGSTGLSAGVYTRQYVTRPAIDLRVRGVAALMELEQRRGITVRRIGLLRPARDAATLERFRDAVTIQRELGVDDAELLDLDGVRRIVPGYDATGVVGALWCPSDGYLDGSEVCSALAAEVQASGARLLTRTTVRGLRRAGGPSRYAVETDGEPLPADVVVNAAGAWSSEVGARLEAPVRVHNERHEAYLFELQEPLPYTVPMLLDSLPEGGGEGIYFRQEGEHQLVVGMHANDPIGAPVEDPDDVYGGVSAANVEEIVERLAAALPDVEAIGYRSGWAGLYPHSPDGELVAGPHPANPDVLVGGGLGGNGLSVAMPLGRTLAEWIRFGEPRTLPDASRFVPRPAVVGAVDPVNPEQRAQA